MEELPPPLITEILSRLPTTADLASARLASRTLLTLSYSVTSARLVCSHARFLRSRPPAAAVAPFRSLAPNLASLLPALHSLFLGLERQFASHAADEDGVDDNQDLHLTATDFLAVWLPPLGRRLRSLAISDYWFQSCWRRSGALSLIADCCDGLLNLEIRNAWLSIEGLRPMLKLTSLTLEYIRLDDRDLDKVNECFPSLRVLNLIGVGGLRNPKIHLSQLRVFQWAVSNFPLTLTIDAPNLLKLKLECVEPKSLVLKTPLLRDLNLSFKLPTGIIRLEKFPNLETLKIESADIRRLLKLFNVSGSVKKLELETLGCVKPDVLLDAPTFEDLVRAFPNMEDLKLGPGASAELEKSFKGRGMNIACECKCLKKLMVHLPLLKPDIMFVSFVLNLSAQLHEVVMLIHADASAVSRSLIFSTFTCKFPRVRSRWGMWKESSDNVFLDI